MKIKEFALFYLVPAGLVYLCGLGSGYIEHNGDTARLTWTLVGGTLFFAAIIGPVILLQYLLCKFAGCKLTGSLARKGLILNAPTGVMVCGVLLYQFLNTGFKETFEDLITRPIPASVKPAGQGGTVAMDSEFWVLRFYIEGKDFERLLHDQNFAPVSEKPDLQRWAEQIRQRTTLSIPFTGQWEAYTLKTNHLEKYLFYQTNNSEAVFILDHH